MSKEIISPIAIDLGAENTGVYFAHYEAGSGLSEIEKDGKVYQLNDKSHTLLMVKRTATRHQRRGFDRRQMAKRLFRLVWEKHLNLPWDKSVQQTVGFLMNRRGFSFLTEEFDADVLSNFPEQAYECLPALIKETFENGGTLNGKGLSRDFRSALTQWGQDVDTLQSMHDELLKEPRKIKRELVVINRLDYLKNYCEKVMHQIANESSKKKDEADKANKKKDQSNKKKDEADKAKLGRVSVWIIDEWKKRGVKHLGGIETENNQAKVLDFLKTNPAQCDKILSSILDNLKAEIKGLKEDIWNFNADSFNLEEADFDEPEEGASEKQKYIRTHLNHLAFALDKTLSELQSGGRYRSKYFKEVGEVLRETKHTHGYLKSFCAQLQAGKFASITPEQLTRLICHIGNLELKPLRKYFNNKNHKKADYWDEARLSRFFGNWILNEWRVGQNNPHKLPGRSQDYARLRNDWESSKEAGKTVIDFWLSADPNLTIPPYQDNNNRRPPKCQSLILNAGYLEKTYPQWQEWVRKLTDIDSVRKYLDDYEDQLKAIKSSKGKGYFEHELTNDAKKDSGKRSQADLLTRVMQFICDRAKSIDDLHLNEIYSHAKKYKQVSSTDEDKADARKSLEDALSNSRLPSELKTDADYSANDLFKQGSFLHLTCKYYKLRQRARDGRIFIHPEYKVNHRLGRGYENTGRFNDKLHLLTYCNHKPRQKRYQMLNDLAGLLQIPPKTLEKIIGGQEEQKIVAWLGQFKTRGMGLEGLCAKAEKMQNKYRGELKTEVSRACFRQKIKELRSKNIKELSDKDLLMLDKYRETLEPSSQDEEFINGCENFESMFGQMVQKLGSENDKISQSLQTNPVAGIYLFAQIANIAYKERQGNANTCAICSIDNAHRMQNASDEKNPGAKAQRLPAIATRLIDGGVMRLARILGKAIANDKWEKIKPQLEAGRKICIPIATESNRFEFEPSKETLVKKQRAGRPLKSRSARDLKKEFEKEESVFESKQDRIKGASSEICPYCGDSLGNDEEIDHIIPRRSSWGTLNDEANLIYAHKRCNQRKGNQTYSLKDLSDAYKQKNLNSSDDKEIEQWIVDQLYIDEGGDAGNKSFKFEKSYGNFANLTIDEQTAFRHALFLKENHDLRGLVLRCINNRNRTFVNGTQRYFVEVLANELHKKALKLNKANLLSFDFFGVSSSSLRSEESVTRVRKSLEAREGTSELLKPYKKRPEPEAKSNEKPFSQKPYSHIIDAQIVFMISLSQHQRDGTYKIDQTIDLWENLFENDKGEWQDFFLCINVADNSSLKKELKREKPDRGFFQHKTLFDSNAGAWHFLKLIEIEVNNQTRYMKGFLELGCLKDCLRQENWEDAIKNNYRYGQDDSSKATDRYGALLTDREVKSIVGLYQGGDGDYQFGCQDPSPSSSEVVLNQKLGKSLCTIRLHHIDKTKVARFLVKNFNTKTNPNDWTKEDSGVFDQLAKLWYFTKKSNLVESDPANKQTIALKYGAKKMVTGGFTNPSLLRAWQEVGKAWDAYKASHGDGNCHQFLEKYFAIKHRATHQKKRKEFSLPQNSEGQGFMMVERSSWDGRAIYQCMSEKSGDDGVGLYEKRIGEKGLFDCLTPYFRSSKIVLLKPSKECRKYLSESGDSINENEYYPLKVPEALEQFVSKISNRYQSKNDSFYKIECKDDVTTEGIVAVMCGGFHIDEMKVGNNVQQKECVKKIIAQIFARDDQYLSVDDSRQHLDELLDNDQNEAFQQILQVWAEGFGQSPNQSKDCKKYLQRWKACFDSIQDDDQKTLIYKRATGLKIIKTETSS